METLIIVLSIWVIFSVLESNSEEKPTDNDKKKEKKTVDKGNVD